MADFDRAYAYEGIARAEALAGNRDEGLRHLRLAEAAGQAISNHEDRWLFQSDFGEGQWFGLR